MDETPAPKRRVTKLGPIEVSRAPRKPRKPGTQDFDVTRIVVLIGLASVLFHEVTYRAYPGEKDLELGGLVSHAGGDLILMLIVIVMGSIYAESRS